MTTSSVRASGREATARASHNSPRTRTLPRSVPASPLGANDWTTVARRPTIASVPVLPAQPRVERDCQRNVTKEDEQDHRN